MTSVCTLLNHVLNSSTSIYDPTTLLLRLRDDVKHQAEELTTVQSRLRDCQTALSDAEVLHCTALYYIVHFVNQLNCSFKRSLRRASCLLPFLKYWDRWHRLIICCHWGFRSETIRYVDHVIDSVFWEVEYRFWNVGSKRFVNIISSMPCIDDIPANITQCKVTLNHSELNTGRRVRYSN